MYLNNDGNILQNGLVGLEWYLQCSIYFCGLFSIIFVDSGGVGTRLPDAPSEINKVGEVTPKSKNTKNQC